jgi:hypothetical protein
VATEFGKGSSGWRFFSAPITPERADPFVNLGDDIDPFKLYQYNAFRKGYEVYPLDLGVVGLLSGHGYFTRLESDAEVDIGGAMNTANMTVALDAAGWRRDWESVRSARQHGGPACQQRGRDGFI